MSITEEKRRENESRYSAEKLAFINNVDALDKGGFCPIPIPTGEKAPTVKGWATMHLTRDDAAGVAVGNIGSRNGTPSGGRTDLDLDWREAVDAADIVMSKLPAHGRIGNPSSHRWALVPGSVTVKFSLPPSCKEDTRFAGGEHALMVSEIRSDGTQTVMPGSINASGECIEWTDGKIPTVMPTIEADKYRKLCSIVAITAVTARCDPGGGAHNDAFMAFAGTIARIIGNAALIDALVGVIAKRWKCAIKPYGAYAVDSVKKDAKSPGLPTLCQRLGLPADVAAHIKDKWLAPVAAEPEQRTPTVAVPFSVTYEGIKATPWAVQNYAVRQAVTIVVAIGGVGKTQWSVQSAIPFVLGEPFMGFKPMRPLCITFVCGEETVEEMQRRLAAAVLHRVNGNRQEFAQVMDRLKGKLFIFGVKDVAVVRKSVEDGKESINRTPFFYELAAHAKASGTDLLIADPVSRLHDGLIENSAEMQHLHNALDAIAMHANCAVAAIHHANKASQGSVDNQQASRGHSSVTDAARIVIVMAPMSSKEAELLLPNDLIVHYLDFVKVGNPKQNYGPNDTQRWLRKVTVKLPVNLEDGTPDARMAFESFVPDASVDILKAEWFSDFLDDIHKGVDGEFYGTAFKGDGLRADTLLVEYGVPKGKRRATLDMLVDVGVLGIEERYSPTREHGRKVYTVLSRAPEQGGIPF